MPKEAGRKPTQQHWYRIEDEDKAWQAALGTARRIGQVTETWRTMIETSYKAYNDFGVTGFGRELVTRELLQDSEHGTTHNLIKSCVQAVANQVFRDPARVRVVTERGNGKLMRQALRQTQFLDGSFDVAGMKQEAARAGLDCLVTGTGVLKAYHDSVGDLHIEHVWPGDILVDPDDGRGLRNRELMQLGQADRDVLRETFPDRALVLEKASNRPIVGRRPTVTTSDNVSVVEAWHLPSAPDAGDGVHMVFCDAGPLFVEEWDVDFFPLVAFRWEEDHACWYGRGIAQDLMKMQMHINEMIALFVESMRMTAMPRIWMPETTNIPVDHLSNPGAILRGGTQPPAPLNFPIMSDEHFYQWLRDAEDWCYRFVGLNEGSVNATIPGSMTSGVAQREYRDNQTSRLSQFAQRWDSLHRDMAYVILELTRRAMARGEIGPKTKGSRFVRSFNWKDNEIERDCYSVQLVPTSNLPNTPAGRQAKVMELANAGVLDRTK